MIEQSAITVWNRLQLLEQVREQRDVIAVQHRESIHVLAQVRMMREDVERIPDATLRIDGVAELFGHQERGDARDVGLPGQHLQVEHQLDVRLDVFRDAGRERWQGQFRRRFLRGLLNPALYLMNVAEVLIEAAAIDRRQLLLQRRNFTDD